MINSLKFFKGRNKKIICKILKKLKKITTLQVSFTLILLCKHTIICFFQKNSLVLHRPFDHSQHTLPYFLILSVLNYKLL
jgi:hypothetical protein